jgi:hypothetical protein
LTFLSDPSGTGSLSQAWFTKAVTYKKHPHRKNIIVKAKESENPLSSYLHSYVSMEIHFHRNSSRIEILSRSKLTVFGKTSFRELLELNQREGRIVEAKSDTDVILDDRGIRRFGL